ncbi:DMSO/TMAO reductase YedYZ molybdopterin-dependent catalytic subunit [Haloactinopolyspora alba]|uniref:DMSO/TMAO reductase YedYZ molybdopterin-dependent catalytic subunit n=1 Tax=Haloactinopolyspora alba TaxID=648780 RepID=A0A2P8DZR4_9ACTN|nr:molybdopterin-dependent oxidoreductase [Haloactinopolyspora alba]PSL02701.1 DMSO/TMAO reductase YedYZ molybdopterin-dependent catalytic subunit [Haloactinopolyspora alba]
MPDPAIFPWFVVITHALTVFFMLMLARSGIEVLASFPKMYWNDGCPPGREWARFSTKMYGADSRRPWVSLDEEEAWNPVIAMPGRKNLGLGRHWHFMTVHFWIATGIVYIAMVFTSGRWHFLIPTEWSVVPDAIEAVGTYLQFELPAKLPGEPYNAVQKLTYFAVVFLLAPLQIITGAAMSPSVLARFPWYGKLFGGKQGARSIHFIGLCAFAGFVVIHTAMVIIHGLPLGFAKIVLGHETADRSLAVAIGTIALAAIVLIHVLLTVFARLRPRTAQHLLGVVVAPFEGVLSRLFTSRQRYTRADISEYHRVNGYPPVDPEYERMAADDFADYRLPVGGRVANPVSLSLAELRELGWATQICNHNCIQGWNSIAEWGGVPLERLVDLVSPDPDVTHVVFYAMDDKGLTEGEGRYGYFYEAVPIFLARHTQSLLALEMNGAPLPIEHGAPVRVRFETQLGYKMVKWIKAVEFVDDVSTIGLGQGGYREDQLYYANAAGI